MRKPDEKAMNLGENTAVEQPEGTSKRPVKRSPMARKQRVSYERALAGLLLQRQLG
jgi:hypothetical protein